MLKILFGSAEMIAPVVEGAEKWSKLFPLGTKHRADFPDGKIEFTREFLATMLANWEREGKPARVVNYNHAQPGSAPYKETVAAGWMRELELRDDGLWARIEWTDEARSFIEAKQFQFLSPEFLVEGLDKNTGKAQGPTLRGAALLNTPYFTELPAVAAQEQLPLEGTEKNPMLKKLCEMLGMPEDSSEEQVMAKLQEKLTAKAEEKPAEEEKQKEQEKQLAETLKAKDAEVIALSERVKTSEEKFAALERSMHRERVEAYVAELVRARKVLPSKVEAVTKIALSDMALAKSLYDDAPAVVPSDKEVGVESGANPDTKSAQAKLDARIIELRKADSALSFSEAYKTALSELKDVKTSLYGKD